MGKALYRKYRSKKLSEIIGQEHITDTLSKALKAGRISHAYLLTGPRGVGKTSIARILAHEINGLPYTEDENHIDIIEIDAASNRRIDEIRELRDKVYIAPAIAKYKVYIIDEVHMLTREAFNALLKTLEEPPEHAIFILATTDAHKLPETIISRTQRFTFKPVEKSKVVAHLKQIAKDEDIEVEDAALELLAEHGEGSFRDSISLLDQASSHGQALTLEHAQQLLGVPSETGIMQLLTALESPSNAIPATMQALSGLYDQGFQAATIAKELGIQLRKQLTTGVTALSSEHILAILGALLEVPISANPERYLEIVLLQSLPATAPTRAAAIIAIESEPAPKIDEPLPTKKVERVVEPIVPPTPAAVPSGEVDETIWPQLLGALKSQYNTLYGVIRMAQPDFSKDGTLELGFSFAFHQKRINDAKNRQIIADIIKGISGKSVQIICILNKDAKPLKVSATAPAAVKNAPSGDLSTISNIFGGGELLES
ncbi:MAG: polymerase subunit gamma/tau [Candidatus Saccharibacteria bacterium]|nr:polymerase subunit gamma/tau [Candidatus Saccharibacteria bacterium]